MNQKCMPLAGKLNSLKTSSRLSMHIPGHKGRVNSSAHDFLSKYIDGKTLSMDITEIEGFDDFHKPEGIIKEAQQLAADLFGAEETFFLTNGTTSGIMAAIVAVSGEGQFILTARDCHKSVTRGFVLSGAEPIYIRPHIDEKNMLSAGISVEDVKVAFKLNPDIKAVVLTHPSYYGTYSDLKEIVTIAHSYGAVVIADEAHGAHLRFSEQKTIFSGMELGADISVQSTHKMLGSLTQSSMLHVQGNLVDRERLAYCVSLMTSTSPSYLLMLSLDAVRYRMALEGNMLWKKICEMTTAFADKINNIPGISVVREFVSGEGHVRPLEKCRLLFSALDCGISGNKLAAILLGEYGIDIEFYDDIYCLAVMGANTEEGDLKILEQALRDISEKYFIGSKAEEKIIGNKSRSLSFELKQTISPRKAVLTRKNMIEVKDCDGKISACEIAVYPPGIPCIQPGEVVTRELIEFIMDEIEKGTHFHGLECDMENGQDIWCMAVCAMEV